MTPRPEGVVWGVCEGVDGLTATGQHITDGNDQGDHEDLVGRTAREKVETKSGNTWSTRGMIPDLWKLRQLGVVDRPIETLAALARPVTCILSFWTRHQLVALARLKCLICGISKLRGSAAEIYSCLDLIQKRIYIKGVELNWCTEWIPNEAGGYDMLMDRTESLKGGGNGQNWLSNSEVGWEVTSWSRLKALWRANPSWRSHYDQKESRILAGIGRKVHCG